MNPRMFDYVKIIRPVGLTDKFRGMKEGTIIQINSRSMLFSVINEINFFPQNPTIKIIPHEVYNSPLFKAMDEV